jgi:hypothetical protein
MLRGCGVPDPDSKLHIYAPWDIYPSENTKRRLTLHCSEEEIVCSKLRVILSLLQARCDMLFHNLESEQVESNYMNDAL